MHVLMLVHKKTPLFCVTNGVDKSEYEDMSVSDLKLAMSYLEEIKKK